ncbi:MAG: GntR family transcriptional regulator [Anaerolineaceae bacterium]|nr:GntR family transcriptional regulator [Anaerolineaceae bacterium]
MEESIDFDNRLSYYLQLKDLLVRQIDSGLYRPGDLLPSESELCNQYQVSRTVVRQALMELEHEGSIYKRRGKGTFVTEPKINIALTQLKTGFSKEMDRHGQIIKTEVLVQQISPATPKVAKYLKVKEGIPVLHIERLRSVNGEPMILVNHWLPSPLCDALLKADLSKSLYETLRLECKITFNHGERIIEAVGANEKESNLLQVDKGTPMLKVVTLSYLEDSTPSEYSVSIQRGDRSTIETKVVNYTSYGKNAKVNTGQVEYALISTD